MFMSCCRLVEHGGGKSYLTHRLSYFSFLFFLASLSLPTEQGDPEGKDRCVVM
jgi:hypothetical protein